MVTTLVHKIKTRRTYVSNQIQPSVNTMYFNTHTYEVVTNDECGLIFGENTKIPIPILDAKFKFVNSKRNQP